MSDEKKWNNLVECLSGNLPPMDVFNRIVTAYSEPHRYYHTFSHIHHCLTEFDEARTLCKSPDEVEFAIWLHDVIYDPHASDNEEKSAQFAKEILCEISCPGIKIKKICDLILITKHIQPPTTFDAQLIVDIDLAILGQPPEIYDMYEKNIRAEYSWVPAEVYRMRRTKVLQSFLGSWQTFNVQYGEIRETIRASS